MEKLARPNQLVLPLLVTLFLLPATGWTKVEYDSNQLMMKNSDQISEMIRRKIKKAQEIQAKQEEPEDGSFLAEPGAIEELKDAMRIVLTRPDQDGTRSNAFSRVRRELQDLNSLDNVLLDIMKEGVSALQSKDSPARRQLTYIVVLENLMAEVRPEMKANATFKRIIEEIRDADLKVSNKIKSEALIRSMSKPVSPSETAAKIIPKEKK
jgi:hypothetical protein